MIALDPMLTAPFPVMVRLVTVLVPSEPVLVMASVPPDTVIEPVDAICAAFIDPPEIANTLGAGPIVGGAKPLWPPLWIKLPTPPSPTWVAPETVIEPPARAMVPEE